MSRRADPQDVHNALAAVATWLHDSAVPKPDRAALAAAVRLTARALAERVPGASVEVRVPPFVAVQCLPGPRHTRGTPPNVAETDPRTWLLVVTGLTGFDQAAAEGRLSLSGGRAADLSALFPLFALPVRNGD